MKILATTCAACLLFSSPAIAQNSVEERTETEPTTQFEQQGDEPRAAGTYAKSNLDQQIAACLLLGNHEEIALAKLGVQHAEHPQVKEFAQMLVDQHAGAVAMIQKAAPEVAKLKLGAGNAGQPTGETGPAGSDRGIAMLQQIKTECLKLTQKELEQHQGAEFDKAFVGQQLGAHIGMLAQLRGSKSFASPGLQKVIADGEKMTMLHMEEVKKIMDQIKDETSKTADASQRGVAPKR